MATTNEIDDLDSIEEGGMLSSELNLSNIYNVKVGGFGDPQEVKTYLCSLTVKELQEDISFYETLSKDKTWPVSQIIQREVDKIRVVTISKDYVLGKGRIVKYFPPIIIAILPRTEDDKIDFKLNFSADQSQTSKAAIFEKSNYRNNQKLREYFIKANNTSLINGLYVLEVSKVFDFNIFCWDKLKYYAVVIDGQHRLDSLIKSVSEKPEVKNFVQDVVFIEFSSLIKSLNESLSPVEVVRRVFIDINTNAKRVGVVRQILMDDKDLSSLFVQSVVDSVNNDGTDKNKEKYIPSQLVDWYGESLKHTLPHLTGILSLYQIFEDFVIQYNISSIDDLRNSYRVTNWVNRMNQYFFVDRKIKDLSDYADVYPIQKSLEDFNREKALQEEYVDDSYNDVKETTLFKFDYRTLEIAQETFENIFSKGIVRFFNNLYPYESANKIIVTSGGFDPEKTLYTALLSSRNKLSHSNTLRDVLSDVKEKIETQLNEKFYIAFTVLGQKALFNLLFKRIFKDYNAEYTEDSVLQVVETFLNDLNSIFTFSERKTKYLFGKRDKFSIDNLSDELADFGNIASFFWEGIIYEDNKIIYNSQGIQSLSSVIEYVIAFKNRNKAQDILPFNISYLKARIKRLLRRRYDELSEIDLDNFADKIILTKHMFLNDYLDDSN